MTRQGRSMTNTELAMRLLKHTLFAGDSASAETIWRAQQVDVRDTWRERARLFAAELENEGYQIVKETP